MSLQPCCCSASQVSPATCGAPPCNLFNVVANGATVLTNVNVLGAANNAFNTDVAFAGYVAANANGFIPLQLVASVGVATLSAVEVYDASPASAVTGLVATPTPTPGAR